MYEENIVKPHFNVVAAIIEFKGKILCVRRGKTKYPYTEYKYEFPGGRIEEGETEQEALVREIDELLRLSISVGPKIRVLEHEYKDFSVTLNFYRCSVVDSAFTITEYTKGIWASPVEMMKLDWVEADSKIVFKKF